MIKHELDMLLGTVKVFDIFESCVSAIRNKTHIKKVSTTDKEFHFQNWVLDRIKETSAVLDESGRNGYPDFKLTNSTESYEIKGLSVPGRETTFDCNSNPPSGFHGENDVYYVFGRYSKELMINSSYPVFDLVICHGQFLNNHHKYIHKNKNVKSFGSYGDIMIRDRKMYVAATPYASIDGLVGNRTLIVPETLTPPDTFKQVGELIRTEVDELIIEYTFNLETNEITTTTTPNPNAGREDKFVAYRVHEDSDELVSLTQKENIEAWVTIK